MNKKAAVVFFGICTLVLLMAFVPGINHIRKPGSKKLTSPVAQKKL